MRRGVRRASCPTNAARPSRSVAGFASVLGLVALTSCHNRDDGRAVIPPGGDPPDVRSDARDPAQPAAQSSASAPAETGPCPPDMALVRAACVDRYEAHLVAREPDGAERILPHDARPPADAAFEARSAAGVFPQAYISRVEASAACERAGKRLCTMDEWRLACEGQRGQLFPYGPRYKAAACNSGKPHLLAQLFGADARQWKYEEQFNDPRLDDEPGFLAKAGEFPECVSDVGIYDLVGNLHEWVSDRVNEAFMHRLDRDQVDRRRQAWRPGNGVFLGGFFSTIRELGPGCKFVTVAHEPTYHDYSTGFRCCAAPVRASAR